MECIKREHLAVALFVASAVAAIGVSTITRGQAGLNPVVMKRVGITVVAVGMLIAAFAMKSAERASHGSVAPVLDRVITKGPYRVIRHPMYLGFLISLVGVAILAQSYFGFACVLVLFLPAVAFRGHLEERELSAQFGDAWREYAQRTWFMIPWIW